MAKLPSRVFLEKHFASGGVTRRGYGSLKSVISMISEMGWELHVIWEGEMAFNTSKRLLEDHITRISRVCHVFNQHLRNKLVIIEAAANTLPDLEGTKGDELDDLLTTWRNKLRVLHVPDGNDKCLFQLIGLHYDTSVHQRLVKLHQYRPNYGLKSLVMRNTEVQHALKELHQIPEAADQLVTDLRAVFEQARQSLIPTGRSSSMERAQAITIPEHRSPPEINKPLPPIPRGPLMRRPTFVARDTEMQNRIIGGHEVSTRRPSTKGKEKAADLPPEHMEPWWSQGSPGSPTPSRRPPFPPNRKQTI